ncbi:MAG: amidohydrolase, partial [Ktedonobacteraceae bacterium]
MKNLVFAAIFICTSLFLSAQQGALSPAVQKYVKVTAQKIVLEHVRVIDGTGKPAADDQNIVIQGGKIIGLGPGSNVATAASTTVLDLHGYSVMPGIVGMHNHLFYVGRPDLDANWDSEPPVVVPQMSFSAPRLYLAGGVTTMRTTGSVEPYSDLNLKRDIDAGKLPGPHLDVTGPYLEGAHSYFIQMHELTGADDAR